MAPDSIACGKPRDQIAFAYCGDPGSNVADSLLVADAMLGMDVRMVALPAFHDRNTQVGQQLFDQAENRMHTIKVAADDPAFSAPERFVGPVYSE